MRVVERRLIHGRQKSGFGQQVLEELVVETSGNGRPYRTEHVEGWWRDAADLRVDDKRKVLRFLQMRGDPLGLIEPGRPIVTSEWSGLITVLEQAASAWSSDPVSQRSLDKLQHAEPYPVSRFHPEWLEGAAGFLRAFNPAWSSDLVIAYRGIEPIPIAKSLASYLLASAAASLRAGRDMRRCQYCSSWFLLHQKQARHCSNSCRAAEHNQRTSPHASRADEAGP